MNHRGAKCSETLLLHHFLGNTGRLTTPRPQDLVLADYRALLRAETETIPTEPGLCPQAITQLLALIPGFFPGVLALREGVQDQGLQQSMHHRIWLPVAYEYNLPAHLG